MLGTTELIIIALIGGAVLFGPSMLPRIGKNIGLGIKELRKVKKELSEPIDLNAKEGN